MLRHGGQVDGLIGRQAQGSVVVLGNVVAIETGPVSLGHQLQAFPVLLV